MRDTLADPSLARYAGRFVWLALDFDKPENQPFIAKHGANYTPSFYVLDPSGERPIAVQPGAMTLSELIQFLDRGARGFTSKAATPADAALAEGDDLFAGGQTGAAAAAYRKSLQLADKTWPDRERAVGSFTWALMMSRQDRECAETAALEAPGLSRGGMFGRVVLAGLMCANRGRSASWAVAARKTLDPLAVEAISLSTTVRDHRFQLYQLFMQSADLRGDRAAMTRWGDSWLKELDATKPANDDERSALDIARVDAATEMDDPLRVLPALIESERVMPANYNASLRLAQIEVMAKRYDEAVAACDRGLASVTGPLGRTWLLQIKADALLSLDRQTEARRVLEDALQAAQAIGQKHSREHNIAMISNMLKQIPKAPN